MRSDFTRSPTRVIRALWTWVRNWGSTEQERTLSLPCDRYVAEPHDIYYRAIDIDAPKEIVWRWLCQMRVAPYSYDWVDNLGKRSPRELTPGTERLHVGQRWFIHVLELVEFEPGKSMTFCAARASWFFGYVACTYVVVPYDRGRSRVVVKVTAYGANRLWPLVRKFLFPWGELALMRRQLLNFKQLAEAQALADGMTWTQEPAVSG